MVPASFTVSGSLLYTLPTQTAIPGGAKVREAINPAVELE
jgi:hypothetical protein